MGKETAIAWTHHTFNTIWGCQKVSPGCTNCYAEKLAKRYGHDVWGPGKKRREFGDAHWAEPLKWDRDAKWAGTRDRVFCASMGDVFEDHPTVRDQLPRLWDVIRRTPNLDWLLLTKRAHRIRESLPGDWGSGYRNVWLGVSCENQECADERIQYLIDVPARVRFLSCEPLLAPIDLTQWLCPAWFGAIAHGQRFEGHLVGSIGQGQVEGTGEWFGASHCGEHYEDDDGHAPGCDYHRDEQGEGRPHGKPPIDWVIVGGESGLGFRPMDPAWAAKIRDDCKSFGAAFFYKQASHSYPGRNTRLEGKEYHEFPELRVA